MQDRQQQGMFQRQHPGGEAFRRVAGFDRDRRLRQHRARIQLGADEVHAGAVLGIALGERAGMRVQAAMGDALAASTPDWIVCAGYMRILGDVFVARFRGRLLNIHPSLLPKYRGLHTHQRALEAGDGKHGASVHFVVPELDAGAVIAQAPVPVHADDTAASLAARVLQVEHPLLVQVLQWAAAGHIHEQDGIAWRDGQALFTPPRIEFATVWNPRPASVS